MSREAMQMAMTALQENWRTDQGDLAIEALRTALAETDVPETAFGETEPVAWANLNALTEQINSVNCGTVYRLPSEAEGRQPLYTAPPQREWVGLTDDEYELMAEKRVTNYFFNTLDYAHDIETKLKEKNT
jgi:hypothetical protein